MSIHIDTDQYLTFLLDGEMYAIDVTKINEVLTYTESTKVPGMPDCMEGVINLRGKAIPVVSMRKKLAMKNIDTSADTCVIITDISQNNENLILGLIADDVSEVMEIKPDAIEPAPKMQSGETRPFLKGMGKKDERFIIMLDIDQVFSEISLPDSLHTN